MYNYGHSYCTVEEIALASQSWNFQTIYGDQEPSRKRVVVPARQATYAVGINSLESIPGLLKSLKNRAQSC